MAELIAAVFVTDPGRPGAKPVLFQPGDQVPERFWPRMTAPALWKDGDVPTAPPGEADGPAGGDPDGGTEPPSGDSPPQPDTLPDAEPETTPAAEDTKQAPAKKPAARKPAPSRKAAAEGTGGQ